MDPEKARLYLAILAAVIALGIILIYFTVSIIRQQRRNLELQKANALAEISAMEQERSRIAADLHDELGPVLSVIKFQVDTIEHADAEEQAQLKKASASLDEMITKLREVANNLMPSALQRKGLIVALEEFTNAASQSSGLAIRFHADAGIVMSEAKSINIYRVVQETVHNTMKHAQAQVMTIDLTEKGKCLYILCKDDGKGFDYENLSKLSEGIGLRSIKNRTEIMGGKITVESKLNVGTAFLFEIPLA